MSKVYTTEYSKRGQHWVVVEHGRDSFAAKRIVSRHEARAEAVAAAVVRNTYVAIPVRA